MKGLSDATDLQLHGNDPAVQRCERRHAFNKAIANAYVSTVRKRLQVNGKHLRREPVAPVHQVRHADCCGFKMVRHVSKNREPNVRSDSA
jgi:hypothetical protein